MPRTLTPAVKVDFIKGSNKSIYYGKITSVVLDDTHPLYRNNDDIGTITFLDLGTPLSSEDVSTHNTARPIDSTFRRYPYNGEIVAIQRSRNNLLTQNTSGYFYSTVVSLWNNPNFNGIPFEGQEQEFGYDVEEQSISPLIPFHGDTIVEGRLGQSIRFSGNQHPSNVYTDESNSSKPFTIINNGLAENVNNEGFTDYTVEDINKDISSIYMMSDHIIPLEQVRSKYDATIEKPDNAKSYKGSQIMFNSGRLFFNAKDNDILLSSREHIGATGLSVSIDSVDYIGLDSKKIYLGTNSFNESQPAVRGQDLYNALDKLLNELNKLASNLGSAFAGPYAVASLNAYGPSLTQTVSDVKAELYKIKSKKTFVE